MWLCCAIRTLHARDAQAHTWRAVARVTLKNLRSSQDATPVATGSVTGSKYLTAGAELLRSC